MNTYQAGTGLSYSIDSLCYFYLVSDDWAVARASVWAVDGCRG